jgi:hypothetical protein
LAVRRRSNFSSMEVIRDWAEEMLAE